MFHFSVLCFRKTVDLKNPTSNQNSAKPAQSRQLFDESQIRTMKGDMAFLSGKGGRDAENKKEIFSSDRSNAGFKKAAPPEKLPVMESIRKPGESMIGPVGPKKEIEKDTGIKTEIDEVKGRLEQWKKSAPTQIRPEMKIEQPKKIDGVKEKKEEAAMDLSAPLAKSYLKFVLGGAALILILVVIGGFFYWKSYRRIPVHLVCQDFQCVEIQGEGENECLLNGDCLPAEPVLPQSLILSPKTRTIEINKGEESSLWDKLESSLSEVSGDETENILERILIKMVDGFNKEYADLDRFLSLAAINIPSALAQFIEQSDINGENYTLFVYQQPEGKRLGLAIELKDGAETAEVLKSWEEDIKNDLSPLFLSADISDSAAEFKDNVYREKNIRYTNFPEPDLSIDYAVIGNMLIIGTSRDSMYGVIDILIDNDQGSDSVSTSTPAN